MFNKIVKYIKNNWLLKNVIEFTFISVLMFAGVYLFNSGSQHLTAIASYLPEDGKKIYTDSLPNATNEADGLRELTMGVLGYAKIIAGAIGILMIVLIGSQLVMARGDEEDISKNKKALIYVIIAFIIISMTEDFAKLLSLDKKGTLLSSPDSILKRVKLFDNQVEILITFVKYFIGAIATVMIAMSGIKLISNGDDEEVVTESKRNIIYSVIGLIFITISDVVINNVFYKVNKDTYSGISGVNPQVDVKQGVQEIVGATNLLIGIIGPVILLILTGASIMYLTAGGDEEKMGKAKRMVIASVIGILVMYGSFAIVSTIISSKLVSIGALTS